MGDDMIEENDGEDNLVASMVEENEGEKPKRKGRPPKGSKEKEVFVDESVTTNDLTDKKIISCSPGDEKWTEFVISKLRPNELDDKGNPKTAGLRRVTENLVGPIVETNIRVVEAANDSNSGRATVEYRISIFWNRTDVDESEEYPVRVFCEVADSSPENTDEPFSKFPTATAASRAEGRALRKALRLDSVVVAEEVTEKAPIDNTINLAGNISSSQISAMENICRKIDVDVMKFVNMGKTKYSNIEDITKANALKMLTLLNAWHRDASQVKKEVKGFKNNWR